MKAIVQDRYGAPDVLELREVDRPAAGDGEVLVRVRAASINPYDWHVVTGTPYLMRIASGLSRPKQKIPGLDLAGQVEAVGPGVSGFRPGDEVFGARAGSFAEYVCARADGVAQKPANLTFEQAAAVPVAGLTALQGLRDQGRIQAGQKVLIIGASGGVGTFAVQLAKGFGAHATAVCSARNADLVRTLGADRVIDYAREDFAQGGERYDLIFELAGTSAPSRTRRALAPRGTLVLCSGEGGAWFGPAARMLGALLLSRRGGQRVTTWVVKPSRADLVLLRELLESGKLSPVIDRRYPLSEVPEALRQQGSGHARGKTVIAV
jgi:NADPH:quinone reductase-like Zn-dependent oxidoreductase